MRVSGWLQEPTGPTHGHVPSSTSSYVEMDSVHCPLCHGSYCLLVARVGYASNAALVTPTIARGGLLCLLNQVFQGLV